MPNQRIYGLDILRAIAILLVIYSHSAFYFGWTVKDDTFWLALGDGVIIFFVLSGYLIGRILFKTIERGFGFRDLLKFWYRRWMRTLPAYFFVITLLMLYSHKLLLAYYT